ncbi:hypothetical protein DPMN_156406 [Dreissena polymorpha]|uniref:MULE transposase domain-containing protein n=1 Tax=Dreissena polymorpha TaxID=45954 RepID=A0A9D4FR83_DREPO|nr:hypothetical protein DPMN_156406 [Dreissena polymorpha]
MMKSAVVEWKCRECSRPAEVVPEVQMETANMAEEFYFVSAAWQAIRQLYPRATVKGCVFHWNQRVYRKVVNEGLATAYAANGDKFLFLRKFMSLSTERTQYSCLRTDDATG